MNTRHTALLASTLLVAATSVAFASEAEEQVMEAYSAWNEAFNSGDAESLGALYTDGATLLPPNHQVFEGPEGVAEFFGGLFEGGVTGHDLELITTSDGEDTVIAAANWSAEGKDANGDAATFSGVATHVFEKQSDGSLKLMLHTFN